MPRSKIQVAAIEQLPGRSVIRVGARVSVIVVLVVIAGCAALVLSLLRGMSRGTDANTTPVEQIQRTIFEVESLFGQRAGDVQDEVALHDEHVDLGFGLYIYVPQPEDSNYETDGTPEPENVLHHTHWVRWDEADSEKPDRAVVLVHGLDEPGSIWRTTVRTLASHGYSVLRFEYPNDGPIIDSANMFTAALGVARADGLGRVTYIAHSMGGLVCTEMLTRVKNADDSLHESINQSVFQSSSKLPATTRLITVGTPFGGSPWAKLRAVAEVRDQVERLVRDDSLGSADIYRHMADGMGEAGDDLLPDSVFFELLNARTFPPAFAVTCIVGTLRQSHRIDPSWMRDSVVLNRLLGEEKNNSMVDSMAAVVDDLGDGVVSVTSAGPQWATDIVHVQASHRGMLETMSIERVVDTILGDAPAENQLPPALLVVLDRLAADDRALEDENK